MSVGKIWMLDGLVSTHLEDIFIPLLLNGQACKKIFGLIQMSIGLSVFRFDANIYKRRAIQLHWTIHNI
jgi:hypothetical protein